MYLLSQIASYLFLAFLLGVGVGYALWRTLGEREVIAKFQAAELRLANYLARWQASTGNAETTGSPFAKSTEEARKTGSEKW